MNRPWLVLGVALVVFCAAWFHQRPATFDHWDACLFEAALDHFDVHLHQPHPPGYPGFILAARLARWVTGDSLKAFQGLNLLGTLGAVFWLTFFAKRAFSNGGSSVDALWAAVLAGIWFAWSPLVRYYSLTALNYSFELPFLAGLFSASWVLSGVTKNVTTREETSFWWWTGLAFWLTAGLVRPQNLFFYAPLWLWVSYKISLRKALMSGLLGAGFLAVEVAGLAAVSGGWAAYGFAMKEQSSLVAGTALWYGDTGALRQRVLEIIFTLGATLGAVWPFAVLGLRSPKIKGWVPFFALAAGPTLAFTFLIHFDKPGYLLPVAPLLFLLAGAGIPSVSGKPLIQALVAVMTVLQMGAGWGGLGSLSIAELHSRDRERQEFFSRLKNTFDWTRTVVLGRGTATLSWHHIRIYCPKFRVILLEPQETAAGPLYKGALSGRVNTSPSLFLPVEPQTKVLLPGTGGNYSMFLPYFPELTWEHRAGFTLVRVPWPRFLSETVKKDNL